MDTTAQAENFSQFVARLPADAQRLHIDILFDRWRDQTLGEEDLRAVEESLEDFRKGERGKPHAEVMRDLQAKAGSASNA